MEKTRLVLVLYTDGDKGFWAKDQPEGGSAVEMAAAADRNGVDGILLVDVSAGPSGHEKTIETGRQLVRILEAPLYMAGNIRRFEDIKKYLYTGAAKVFCLDSSEQEMAVLTQGAERFGSEKTAAGHGWLEPLPCEKVREDAAASVTQYQENGLLFLQADEETDYFALKEHLKCQGVPVVAFEPQLAWADLKKGADGLVPCIVQDYRTNEVLMMAYMNEEAYQETSRTGKMCYYSRSRQSRWLKGETSGHFQYVKALYADCDKDTLLARVAQVGAACHTGSYSCFFNEILKKEGAKAANPHQVFEDVYRVILDRKEHPREGSYTNYLFDKGIDKILKKCGEEATEIVIAAKNPDPEEIKYEISDFLYHVMVLMAVKGVTWEDITRELANR